MSESHRPVHPMSREPTYALGVDPATAYAANRAWWDEITGPHARSDFYDLEGFKAGRNRFLQPYIVEEVGDVAGKSLLHLQCHIGLDTISWARLGAKVTGVDFGGEAITFARNLAAEESLDATFVQSNIYDIGDRFDGQFDVVFTSYGVLAWLHDLREWGQIAARALKPGGIFYIAEFHSVADTLQDTTPIVSKEDAYPSYPYFDPGKILLNSAEEGVDYASDHSTGLGTYEWFHSLQDVLMALIDAGLQIELFHEQDFCVYRMREGMLVDSNGLWRLPETVPPLPLMYSIRAGKPGR